MRLIEIGGGIFSRYVTYCHAGSWAGNLAIHMSNIRFGMPF